MASFFLEREAKRGSWPLRSILIFNSSCKHSVVVVVSLSLPLFLSLSSWLRLDISTGILVAEIFFFNSRLRVSIIHRSFEERSEWSVGEKKEKKRERERKEEENRGS